MQFHVNTLHAKRHRAFLEQRCCDPVTKEPFGAGDRVVMCATCRSAFLESSWRGCGGSHCGQQNTLRDIAVDTTRRRLSPRESLNAAQSNGATARGATHTAAFPHIPPTRHDPQELGNGTAGTPIKLAEVPINLADVPVQLKSVIILGKVSKMRRLGVEEKS